MHVSIIGTAGIPAQYGGFETLTENIINYGHRGICYTVFCSKKNYKLVIPEYHGARLKYVNLQANGYCSIIYDIISILRSLKSDSLLILGISSGLSLPLVRLLYRGKIITNIDGSEWQRQKSNGFARAFLHLSEALAILFSDIVIADNQVIWDYVARKYGKQSVLIEYGSDHVIGNEDFDLFIKFEWVVANSFAISVCRIEPENNIVTILKAFARQDLLTLVIVGNWQKSNFGRKLYSQYNGYKRIILLNPIYDKRIINFLRCHATIYVHGHSMGGTNPSLVEAMNLRLPVLAFDCAYNRTTTENQCEYWSDSQSLVDLLCSMDYSRRKEIAKAMGEIAERRYRWSIISEKYEDLFIC